ncbi:MAG: Ppx/GppA family phosphatase [Calditerrivibrio sp.]|nr:Ppx/GppA family phosphatase [Calditerrivibrio sp.]
MVILLMDAKSVLNKNICVIDLGSNSVRLQIATVYEKSYKIVCEYKELIRIGDDLFKNGILTNESTEKIYKIFSDMKTLIDNHNVFHVRAVATATLRGSPNGKDVVDSIRRNFNIPLEIIDGQLEAKLSFLGVKSSFDIKRYRSIITDIGGGSSEFIYSKYGEIEKIVTKKLGGARLKYQFLQKDPPTVYEFEHLKQFLRKELSEFHDYETDALICTGGTANNIALIHYFKDKKDTSNVIKYVPREFLREFITSIKKKKSSTIARIKGVEPRRSDILLPVAVQIDQLLEVTGRGGFYTFSGGLRTGLIIDTLNNFGIRLPFQTLETDVNVARLTEIGNKFDFDEAHANQVTKLAHIIFSQCRKNIKLEESDWSYLHAASMLHDIGNFISLSKHHLHSEYLIQNTDLTGFNSYEKFIISQIARYHRKRLPKKSDKMFSIALEKDIVKIIKLSAILRIADALDRTHSNRVTDIKISFSEKTAKFKLIYNGDISMEKENFHEKKDFFEKYTNYKVEIE